MKKIILGAVSVALVACAQTTIYPVGGDAFSSVSTSSHQSYAEKDAQTKAEAHCQKFGKRLMVVNHNTQYRGPDVQTKMMGGIAAEFLGGPNHSVSSSDYEVTMKFRCV